ncbi:MAG: FtsX-like permease family protein [Pseudomonadota bacterium]
MAKPAAPRRPRRLATSDKDAPATAPPPQPPAATPPPPADPTPTSATREERFERRREIKRTARARRQGNEDAPAPPPEETPAPEAEPTEVVEEGAIVAKDTIAGRGLTAVIAIMTFVCTLLVGAAFIIDGAADRWSRAVLDDVTVTVLPLDGTATNARLQRVATALEGTAGIDAVTILPLDQSEALLTPWLGTTTDLSLLPIPRMVTATRIGPVDLPALRKTIAAIEGATLDDHGGWSETLSQMAGTVTTGAVALIALMLCATVLSIIFATRAAIASNATTVGVLLALGAEDRFIERTFRRRFVRLALRGSAIGVSVGLVLFGALEAYTFVSARAVSAQAEALLGAPRIGPKGFATLVGLAIVVAFVVALSAHLTVRRHLSRL